MRKMYCVGNGWKSYVGCMPQMSQWWAEQVCNAKDAKLEYGKFIAPDSFDALMLELDVVMSEMVKEE